MPRHTWNVRIELCETFDVVYAHAVLEDGPIHYTGHGRATLPDRSRVAQSRSAAVRRSLAELTRTMQIAAEGKHLVGADGS